VTPWSGTSAALIALFTDLSKDLGQPTAGYSAEWREAAQKEQHVAQGFKLQLKVTSVRGVGQDETRRRWDAQTQTSSTYQYCLRSFTLQVRAKATQLIDGRNPMAVLERVRTRIHRPSSQDALAAVSCALVGCGPATDLSAGFDDRVRPEAVMDVVLQGAFTDADPVYPGWIEFVEVTGRYLGSVDSPIVATGWVPTGWVPTGP
jgi:hypothetical protein